jgi:hypothetical protein
VNAVIDDRCDYERFIEEYGLSPDLVRQIVENETDQTPMPEGFDALRLGESEIQGRGMFATRSIHDGELIAPMRICRMRTPAGRFTNHSPTPNAKAVAPDIHNPLSDLIMVAVRQIREGEEVKVDYRQVLGVQNFHQGR